MKYISWLTYHKLACCATEYILALDRFSWTTRGVWSPSSKNNFFFFSLLEVLSVLFWFVCGCFPGAVESYCFQDPWLISKYGRCGYVTSKIAIKWGGKDRDDIGGAVLRVQTTFPNIERRAFLNEKLQ